MQRDLGLTAEEASQRLVNEAEAGTRAGLLRTALGDRFAGAWLNGRTASGLTVATTSSDDTAAIRAQGAEPAVVDSSLDELKAVKEKLDSATVRNRAGSVALDAPVWYVDVRTNRVVLQGTSRAAAERVLRAAGLQRDRRVAVRVSDEQPRALADIVGGDAYYIDDTFRCSVGFSVTKDTQQGFVSAGHCGQPGSTTAGANTAPPGRLPAVRVPRQGHVVDRRQQRLDGHPAGQGRRRQPRAGQRRGTGAGRGVGVPVGLHHRLALRHDPAGERQRPLRRGPRRRADPDRRVRRTG
ncbi:hypothetical protein GCM10020256_35850 [Streptomyces thermocoprophilus]